jgi:predicted NACHT family NTPase
MLKKLCERYEKGEAVIIELIRVLLHEICPLFEVIQSEQVRPTLQDQIVFPTQEQFAAKFLSRFQGAKVSGFEGVRLLNMKINRKRKDEGLAPIDVAVECKRDIADREDSQYMLFQEIVKYFNNRINVSRFNRGLLKDVSSSEKALT